MDYHLTFKKKEFENLRSVIFVIHIIPYFLFEVILHYNRKKGKREEKKHNLL